MHGDVIDTAWLTPSLMRVRLGGGGLAEFAMIEQTDAYINAAFAPDGASYEPPFDLDAARKLSPEERPARRRYTVRHWDPGERVLTIDVVVHGDAGVGGPWARAARPGTPLMFSGPAGGYRPDPAASWHLMVGDESALPAIAASLEAVPDGAPVVARLVCDGPDHEIDLRGAAELDVVWLHRTARRERDADLLAEAVRDLEFPSGQVHAFVHGEAAEVREVRRHLLADRGVTRGRLSASAYWRWDMTDERWREIKQMWNAEVEQDVPTAS